MTIIIIYYIVPSDMIVGCVTTATEWSGGVEEWRFVKNVKSENTFVEVN